MIKVNKNGVNNNNQNVNVNKKIPQEENDKQINNDYTVVEAEKNDNPVISNKTSTSCRCLIY
jgi:hypothetical protein